MKSKVILMLLASTVLSPAAYAQASTKPPSSSATDGPPSKVSIQADQGVEGDVGATGASPEAGEIVVTGTLLRGIAPTGTNVVAVNRDAILNTGVSNSNDLLSRIPQAGSFNQLQTPTADIALPINRPNIRNLGASGSSTTLVLINGRRAVGQGVLQTSVDPSVIPPGILDRVDVIPDGGSSIYGSDAIGGVINFITRKRFDGLEASSHYGFADNYKSFDANVTAGKDWGSGSFLVSYAYAWHSNLFGGDRDYITQDHRSHGSTDQRTTTCAPGNITANGVNYTTPNLVPGQNQCDEARQIDIYPREERHSVFASLTQELTDNLTFNATAYWSQRATDTIGFGSTNGTGLRGTGTITSTNPYFQSIAGETSQAVALSFAGVSTGKAGTSHARLVSQGVTPEFVYKVGGDWQLRVSGNFGRSYTAIDAYRNNQSEVAAALAGTTTQTALNPYNLAATNPAVLSSIFDYDDAGRATQDIAEARIVGDGTLIELPGGNVRLAVGGEYHYEDLDAITTLGRIGTTDGFARGQSNREVASAFGEVFFPIFGNANGFAGMRSLDLSVSVRYDHYNDVGGTTNPKIGFNWKPIDDLKIRGNWGTSFHAPSLADLGGAVDTRVQIIPVSPFRTGSSPASDLLRSTVILAGGNPSLTPEKAHTWSIGADYKPAYLPGLTVSGTYWNVDFKDAIGLAPFYTGLSYFGNAGYASFYTINPTLSQVQAAAGTMRLDGASNLESLYANGTSPYILIDARRNNLGRIKTSGIDFNVAYNQATAFGEVNAGIAGTYTLTRKTAVIKGAPFQDDLKNGVGRLSFAASLGAKVGPVMAQATINYSDSYPILGDPTQTTVKSFTTTNILLSYDLPGEGVLAGSAITLNVDNVFDVDPPYYNDFDGVAYTNIGRAFTIGIRKKF